MNCDPANAYITIDQHGVPDLPDNLPCSDIRIVCNVTQDCLIRYNDAVNSPLNTYLPFFNCYGPIYYHELFDIRCLGTCPESPTSPPTADPSSSPTSLSIAPSNAPTFSPSASPTRSPSLSPSIFPSFSPSLNPTYSPTHSPSESPTSSPLALSDFDSFIDITYVISEIGDLEKDELTQNAVSETNFIQSVINEAYSRPEMSYDKYLVQILDIEGILIADITAKTNLKWINLNELKLQARVDCNSEYCDAIKLSSQSDTGNPDDFSRKVKRALSNHYNNFKLDFYVNEPQALDIVCKNCETAVPNYVLYGLISLVMSLCVISVCAFLYNKKRFPRLPGFHPVDNAKWTSITIFAVQFWYVSVFAFLLVYPI